MPLNASQFVVLELSMGKHSSSTRWQEKHVQYRTIPIAITVYVCPSRRACTGHVTQLRSTGSHVGPEAGSLFL